MLAAKRFHPARSSAAPRRPLGGALRSRRCFDLRLQDFGDDGLRCGYEKLALLVAGKIVPFETSLVGLRRGEALGRLKGLDLELDCPIDGNTVLGKQMQFVFSSKFLRVSAR